MLNFRLVTWSALAPGLSTSEDWNSWFAGQAPNSEDNIKALLRPIPPMLRRRFTPMGRIAAAGALSVLSSEQSMPVVFASRHGDIDLTLSLLQNIAKDEALSPTGFSLAVHNATVGLLSIARKDPSAVTAIAATEHMIPMALLEAATQLQESTQVLCLICDTPVPELYRPYTESSDIPYTLALVLSRDEGDQITLSHQHETEHSITESSHTLQQVIGFLNQEINQVSFTHPSSNSHWLLTRN